MLNFSFGELLVLGVIGLIVLGPKQLPRAANIMGRVFREFKKALSDVTSDVAQAAKSDLLSEDVGIKRINPPKLDYKDLRSIESVMKELGK